MDIATAAQIASAVSNFVFAAVFVVGYLVLIKQNRETLQEMRAARAAGAGGRPQVMVEADYARLPMIDIVVRNVGGGVAKDVRFDFSAPLVSSSGFALSDLLYFKTGIDFLGTGEEVRSFWDSFNDLVPVLRKEGLEAGVTATVRYQDLAGDSYEDRWNINPLLYEDEPVELGGYKGMNDLVEVMEKISRDLEILARRAQADGNEHGKPSDG